MPFIRCFFSFLKRIGTRSIRRQLAWSFSLTAIIIISSAGYLLFSWQKQFLYQQGKQNAFELAQTLAFSSVSWVLANDVVGLQEVLQGTANANDLKFALVSTPDGEVLAATKTEYIGQFFTDPISQRLLTAPIQPQILIENKNLIDVAVPIKVGNTAIGWIRVEFSREAENANLYELAIHIAQTTLLLAVMMCLIAIYLARGLTAGLNRLAEVANAAEKGLPFQRHDNERIDEIGLLARHLYKMLDSIEAEKKATQASETRFRRLFQTTPIPIACANKEGIIQDFNNRFVQIFGYSSQDIPTVEAWYERAYPDPSYRQHVVEMWNSYIQTAIESGQDILPAEYNITCKNGDVRIMEISGVLLGEDLLAAFIDLTERKQAESVLRKREEQLQLVLEGAHLGFWDWNIVTNEVDRNAIWAEMLGYSYQEIQHTTYQWSDFIHPDDRERAWQSIYNALEGKTPFHEAEYRMFHKDGTLRWILDHASVVQRDADGKPIRMSGTHTDITRRKQAEEALRQERDFADNLIETAQVIILVLDMQGCIVRYNSYLEKLSGYPLTEMQGKNWIENFLPKYEQQRIYTVFKNAASGIQTKANINPILTRSGEERQIEWFDKTLLDADGNVTGVLAVGQDVTERLAIEQELAQYREHLEEQVQLRTAELQKAKEAAEAANIAKSTFIATMSHELRTPLNAILGFSELMQSDKNTSLAQKQTLEIINRSGAHLLSMINDVLEISKIEAGRLELDIQPCDLLKLLHSINDMFMIRANNKQLSFDMVIEPTTPQFIQIDNNKLRQILINLLGNALKFTKQGGVKLHAYSETSTVQQILIIEVVDTGIGIPKEKLADLFKPFSQLARQNLEVEGTGLGLAISKSLTELMGGKIHVHSELGVGSTFKISLPITLAKPIEIKTSEFPHFVESLAANQPKWRLLVVDDNPDNRLLLSSLLHKVGFVVQEAENGQQAIKLFHQWQPHLIWMDMQMPVMDGYETTQTIRNLPLGEQVKIIAVTASAFKEQQEKILKSGCDAVIHKPFQAQEIFSALSQYLGVKFIYQDKHRTLEQSTLPTLTPEVINQLPLELRQQLHQAAQALDIEAVEVLLKQTQITAPDIAVGLQNLAENYQFEEIIRLLARENSIEHK